MIGAFTYLIVSSVRNQIRARAARLRNPRYALALIIGVAYVWFAYLRPTHGRPHAGDLVGGTFTELLPLLALAYVSWTWLAGGDGASLAFTQAEVTLLFTAPVARRTLLLYKIVRTQVRILTTSLVWSLIFHQAATRSGTLLHAASYWVLLSALHLNSLGVSLVHANAGQHGLRGARRNWLPIVVVPAIIAMVIVPIAAAWPRIVQADGASAMADVLTTALSQRPASWALFPFHLVLAPLGSPRGMAWLASLWPALLLLAGLLAWVLGTDAAFEEAAADASTRRARRLEAMRSHRSASSTQTRNGARTISLSPNGTPAMALLWKNAMWLLRSGALRGMLLPPLLGLVAVVVLGTRNETTAEVIAGICLSIAAILLVMGPMTMRNDLRSELLHLSLLKTFPLRGRDIVMVEVASSAMSLAASQYLLVLVAMLAFGFSGLAAFTPEIRLAAIVGSVPLLIGANCAVSMIHNALALLFPGWVRLGAEGGGVETLGLGMINLSFALVMLGLLLILPAAVIALTIAGLRQQLALALLIGAVMAGALLVLECVMCAWALGGTLDRMEPMQVEG